MKIRVSLVRFLVPAPAISGSYSFLAIAAFFVGSQIVATIAILQGAIGVILTGRYSPYHGLCMLGRGFDGIMVDMMLAMAIIFVWLE